MVFSENSRITGIIDYRSFDIDLSLDKDNMVSRFPAATIRGGFGITLRKLVCPTMDILCSKCLLRHNCVYCYLFETVPEADSLRMKNYRAVPHPFTLYCNQQGNAIKVKLVLVGKAIESLSYFIYTLRKLGKQGLGKQKVRYRLSQVSTGSEIVYQDGSDEVKMKFQPERLIFEEGIPLQGSCILQFYSPVMLRKDGKFVDRYDNHAFFTTLLRRITTLYAIHCNGQNFEDCRPLIQKWNYSLSAEIYMVEVKNKRYSTRQQREIAYDGFTGDVKLTGDIGTFMPFLKAGEILSVGKNTAFGFGKYRIIEVNS